MDDANSRRLGKYQLVTELARGGIGIVHLAVTTGRGRFTKRVVVKELQAALGEDPLFTEMFLEEARLAARLDHPNIVRTYEAGQDGTRQYMVMEYLDGVSLNKVLRRKPAAFTRAMHLRTICEMLQGLTYAHELRDFDGTPLGLVHRDVSPQNTIITYDGQIKLLDFGIAKAMDSEVATRVGAFKGKPAFMSPEQLEGLADARSDVFSAGVMIWEAVAGTRMWPKKSNADILMKLARHEVPKVAVAAPNAPSELVAICDRATAPDREERYASAAELHAELDAYLKATDDASAREIGATLAEVFESERAQVRLTIEMQLSRLKAADSTRNLDAPPSGPSLPPAGPEPLAVQDEGVLSPERRRLFIAYGVGSGTAVGLALLFVLHRDRPARADDLEAPAAVVTVASAAPVANARPEPSASESMRSTGATAASAPGSVAALPNDSVATAPLASAPARVPLVQAPVAQPAPPLPAMGVAKPPQVWAPRPPPQGSIAASTAPTPSGPSTAQRSTPQQTASGDGYLTIDTYPWTHVSIAGRVLGGTPLVHVPLAPGTYTLTFDNPGASIHKSTVVTIKAGETVDTRIDL